MGLKEIKKGSVALLMPCGGPVEPRVLQSAMNLISQTTLGGVTIRQVGITDRTLIHQARNHLAKGFLETDCEWSFWMDSDMILEPRTILVMLEWAKRLNSKMLTGIYYQRMGDHKPVIWRKIVKSKDGKIVHAKQDDYLHFFVYPAAVGGAPFLVDTAGFGCALIHRDVYTAIKYPYFQFVFWDDEEGKPCEASEDFYFFVHAAKAGYKLWAVPELKCGHVGTAQIIEHKDMKLDMAKMTEMDMSDMRPKEALPK